MSVSLRSSPGTGLGDVVIEPALGPSFLLVLLVFGLLPGTLLRLIVQIYPKHDPRRDELLAELYAVEYYKRPFVVAQDLELAIFEGVPARWRSRRPLARPGLMRDSGFRGALVCKVSGITYRQLDYWARTGIIRPSSVPIVGEQRRWSYTDILEVKLVKWLLEAGVPLRSARKAMQHLRSQAGDLSEGHQVITRSGPILCRSDEELVELLSSQPGVLTIVSMASIKGEVDAAILALRSVSSGTEPGGARRLGEEGGCGWLNRFR